MSTKPENPGGEVTDEPKTEIMVHPNAFLFDLDCLIHIDDHLKVEEKQQETVKAD